MVKFNEITLTRKCITKKYESIEISLNATLSEIDNIDTVIEDIDNKIMHYINTVRE